MLVLISLPVKQFVSVDLPAPEFPTKTTHFSSKYSLT
jgi:hypothetical protein